MGSKLAWTGLTLIVSAPILSPVLEIPGVVIMIIGTILIWLDK